MPYRPSRSLSPTARRNPHPGKARARRRVHRAASGGTGQLWRRIRRGWLAVAVLVLVGVSALLITLAVGNQPAGREGHAPRTGATDTLATQPPPATGIFTMGEPGSGPPPVPANVMHAVNMARFQVGQMSIAAYAGFMTRMPQVGALFLLQQQLVTGAQTTHLYQTPQPVGSLTIRAVQGTVLLLTTSSQQGTFDLRTELFHFSPLSSLWEACARCALSANRHALLTGVPTFSPVKSTLRHKPSCLYALVSLV